jgi:dipeptidyl aminopeptidase/acylaminoacyl peptidase
VAGGPGESVLAPAFSPDGSSLAYLSDRDGWWGIYLYDLASGESRRLTRDQAEYGGPAWVQGLRFFSFAPDGELIYALRAHEGVTRLVRVEVLTGEVDTVALDERLTALEQVAASPDGETLAMIASGPDAPPRLLTLDINGGARVLAWTSTPETPREWFSSPQILRWTGEDGGEVHGLFYPPASPRFRGEGPPPLVVYVHSGPTSQAARGFAPRLSFFTSRGFAVLAVNYRGSSGYGRAYRQALQGRWGELDVADVVSGARQLAESGRADIERMVLLGSSAGGATALLALAGHPGLFRAAIVAYPVVDHLALEGHIHPFEAHYSRGLLGPLPEAAALYRERSPLTHAGKIRAPLLLFHGEEDRVVPRSGSDALADAVRGTGVPVRYHVFPGEGHGFRNPETLEAYYRAIEELLRDYVI